MNVDSRLADLRRAAARRRLAIAWAAAAPLAIALVVLAARIGGVAAGVALGMLGFAALAGLARRALRVDATWLARRLDATLPPMEDSAALLFRDGPLSELQRLQRARLRARLADLDADLRPPWSSRTLAAAAGGALLVLLVAMTWSPSTSTPTHAAASAHASGGAATTLSRSELLIGPPAYTGLAARTEAALDAKAPQGARLHWRLRFDPVPQAAALAFHDGRRVALRRDGADWIAEHALTASTLYRIALDGAPALVDDRLFRLDAIADRAPEVRVLQPDKTLTLLADGQTRQELAFEASDDFGIAGAKLTLTLAQGGGENIAFKEQTLRLDGEAVAPPASADARAPQNGLPPPAAGVSMRYRHTLDLAALGIAAGDDVIVRLAVTDNREPEANTTRSASLILRWPEAPAGESAGLAGIAQKAMPAYFRSQRQIIIDSEALLAESPRPDEAAFLARSDAIGVDQKILRLRYGQFLGEESETQAEHAPESPHGDHDGDAPTPTAAHAAQEHPLPTQSTAKFGEEGDTLAEYGHVHDIAEAATLLDADTRAILKSALAEMWQAELHLRQGHPDLALPYEHRALEFIKQVQQSTRIYLARVGLELPAPDETRRLSGERKDLADRVGSLTAAADDERTIAQLWQALADGGTPEWAAAASWLRANPARAPDALGVLAALDAAQRDPACADCRARLHDLLWPLLPTPAAATAPRAAPDAAGRAYLDALRDTVKGAG